MKKYFYFLLLMILTVIQTKAQITFKLKSVVGHQNPSSNGLFSYGTLNGGNFQLFPQYGEDGTGYSNGISQKGWTFVLGQESYPFLAFEQLNAGEITPQPFPPFGIFMHPSPNAASVVKLAIPNNATIISITSNVQRPSFGCGENIGYSIMTDHTTILARTIIPTSNTPSTISVGTNTINAGNSIYFIVDKGDDGDHSCDDTAIDVEISLSYDKIVTPILSGTLNCSANSATFDIAYQRSGVLELYQLENPNPIATTSISQVGNTFNGQGTFSGLDFTAGGSYFVIARNDGQEQSAQSAIITVSPCCRDAVAPIISVNNLTLCEGQTGILTATGCTNGIITWNNGMIGASITANSAGTFTAICKVLGTPPCADATSTASGTVIINAPPTLTIGTITCSTDLLNYSINFTSDGMVTSSAGTVSENRVINIPIGTNVSLTARNNAGCSITQTINSPACTCPVVNVPVSGGDKTICIGQAFPTLSVSIAENEVAEWYDAPIGGNLLATGQNFVPGSEVFNGGLFYVQAKNLTNNCISNARVLVRLIVNSKGETPVITSSKNPLILGETAILSIANCNGVITWNTGEGTSTISVKPNASTEYTATCTANGGCIGGKGKITIEVKPPSISISGKDVCWGAKPTLTQTGCASSSYWIVWKKDDFSDAQAIDNPNTYPITEPTRFKVACSTTAGEGSGEILIRPISLPETPKIIPNKGAYFSDETVELNVLNCEGYLRWSTGENGFTQIRVKPSKTSTYSVNCSNGAGCNAQSSIEIVVKTPNPKVKDLTVCYGDTLTLNSGCVNNAGLWTENWLDIPNRITRKEGEKIKMIASNTFGVSCEGEAGLSEMVAFTVRVKPQINAPEIQSKKRIIVKGESLELIANGCTATEWTDDKNTVFSEKSNKLTVSPTTSTTFSAKCFNDGCYGDFTNIRVSVRPIKPKIKVSLDTLCLGNATTISAQNCENGGVFKWIGNDNSLQEFTIRPQTDTTFKAVCISLESTELLPLISDTTIVKIHVYQTPNKPVIGGETIIIKGEKTTLTADGCLGNILWNTGEKTQSIRVRPDKNTIYTATCGIWQCISDTASIKIRVRPRPIEIQTSNGIQGYSIIDTVCINKQLNIRTLNQCDGEIVWSNGQNGEKIQVSGSRFETQKYSLYCVNADAEKSDESTAIITVLNYDVTDAIAYPNPTTGKLYIKSKGCIDGVKLVLYSQRGEKLYEGGGQERYLDSIVLDLYHLPSETYILHIIGTDGNKPMTLKKRIIKVNN